jgi:hypothetical protein
MRACDLGGGQSHGQRVDQGKAEAGDDGDELLLGGFQRSKPRHKVNRKVSVEPDSEEERQSREESHGPDRRKDGISGWVRIDDSLANIFEDDVPRCECEAAQLDGVDQRDDPGVAGHPEPEVNHVQERVQNERENKVEIQFRGDGFAGEESVHDERKGVVNLQKEKERKNERRDEKKRKKKKGRKAGFIFLETKKKSRRGEEERAKERDLQRCEEEREKAVL